MRLERFRQRVPRPHPLVDVVQHRLEERVRNPAAQDVERLDERHAGLEQRRELLIEDEELPGRHPRARRQRDPAERGAPGPLNAEDVKPLFLELLPEPRLGVGGVDALDDLAAGSAQPAAELHPLRPCPRRTAQALVTVDIIGLRQSANYIPADFSRARPRPAIGTADPASAPMVTERTDPLIRQGNWARPEKSRAQRVPGPASDRMRLT